MISNDNDLPIAQQEIEQLFKFMNITKIMLIDDDYELTIDTIIELLIQLEEENIGLLESIIGKTGSENGLLKDRNIIRQKIEILIEEDPQYLGNTFQILTEAGIKSQNSNRLEYLFKNYEFKGLSPSQWRNEQNVHLNDEMRPKTLYLFDKDFGDEPEGGMRLISSLLTNYKDVFCGLISGTFMPEKEYDEWITYTETGGAYKDFRNSFALISKVYDSYRRQVEPIKRVVLNRRANEYLARAAEIINRSYNNAHTRLKGLNIYDIEQIVFQSSYTEGVWEFETLVRITNILQRVELINLSKGREDSEKLTAIANEIRQITSIGFHKSSPTQTAIDIRKSELYDESEIINKYHLPIELGDIFEITIKAQKRHFILLAQPCDLMIREKSGKRTANEGVIVQLRNSATNNLDLSYPIEHFQNNLMYVDFRQSYTHIVDLNILDFVVYNNDGDAIFNKNTLEAPNVINSWKKRYELLHTEITSKLELFSELEQKLQDDPELCLKTISSLLPVFSRTLSLAPTVSDGLLSYPIKRIKRLRQPLSGTILTRYANSMARVAFEHDFVKLATST